MGELTLRRAGAADEPFLREMLALAAGWRDDVAAELTPETERYVEGFGRPGDAGVVALTGEEPVGAAWYRHFTAAEPAYGYVADDVPEMAIAVRAGARGSGAGSALLERLLAVAADEGVPGVSLSVEADNPARLLYERFGFAKVGEAGASWTMVRRLR